MLTVRYTISLLVALYKARLVDQQSVFLTCLPTPESIKLLASPSIFTRDDCRSHVITNGRARGMTHIRARYIVLHRHFIQLVCWKMCLITLQLEDLGLIFVFTRCTMITLPQNQANLFQLLTVRARIQIDVNRTGDSWSRSQVTQRLEQKRLITYYI